MRSQRMKIRLRGNNRILVNQSAERIVELAEQNGAKTSLPISLPTMKDSLTKSRTHRRSIDILEPTSRTVDALMGMELPDSVDIEIKL